MTEIIDDIRPCYKIKSDGEEEALKKGQRPSISAVALALKATRK